MAYGKWIAGAICAAYIAIFPIITVYVKNKQNQDIETSQLTSHARATGLTSKIEYTKLKDGSEEVLINTSGAVITLYQNFDGDDTVDRIRVDKYVTRDTFTLDTILLRETDYQTHQKQFKEADDILKEQRQLYSQPEQKAAN
jgi:hypothetical protein